MTIPASTADEARIWIIQQLLDIQARDGSDHIDAADTLVARLAPDAARLWRFFGRSLILGILGHASRMAPMPAPSSRRPGIPWTEACANAGLSPLDCTIAIAHTGVRKSFGDLTEEDCRTIANVRGRAAETLTKSAKGFASLAKHLKPGETVGQVWAKLPATAKSFVHREAGVARPESPASIAA